MARLRTFIALPLEGGVRHQVERLQADWAELAGETVKWVEPANLHVTLLFLGEVSERDVVGVCRRVTTTAVGLPPFSFRVVGVGGFPSLRHARALYAEIGTGIDEIRGLHSALETALIADGSYRREERAFTPHITLGRVSADGVPPWLAAQFAGASKWSAGTQAVNEVQVLNSLLTKGSPVYTVMSRAPLRGAPVA